MRRSQTFHIIYVLLGADGDNFDFLLILLAECASPKPQKLQAVSTHTSRAARYEHVSLLEHVGLARYIVFFEDGQFQLAANNFVGSEASAGEAGKFAVEFRQVVFMRLEDLIRHNGKISGVMEVVFCKGSHFVGSEQVAVVVDDGFARYKLFRIDLGTQFPHNTAHIEPSAAGHVHAFVLPIASFPIDGIDASSVYLDQYIKLLRLWHWNRFDLEVFSTLLGANPCFHHFS